MNGMDDLIIRLKAAMDETERVALGAKNHTGRWRWDHGVGDMCNDRECPYGSLLDEATPDEKVEGTVLMQVHGYDITRPWEGAEHIARHDPASVLRMVAAHRKILDTAENVFRSNEYFGAVEPAWRAVATHYRGVLEMLAEGYGIEA